MQELTGEPIEDVLESAAKKENFLFKKPGSRFHAPVEERSADNPDYAGLDPNVATIIRITDGFSSDLRRLSGSSGNEMELRKELKAFIDVIEDLYKQMW